MPDARREKATRKTKSTKEQFFFSRSFRSLVLRIRYSRAGASIAICFLSLEMYTYSPRKLLPLLSLHCNRYYSPCSLLSPLIFLCLTSEDIGDVNKHVQGRRERKTKKETSSAKGDEKGGGRKKVKTREEKTRRQSWKTK